jgi:hypothetical protein
MVAVGCPEIPAAGDASQSDLIAQLADVVSERDRLAVELHQERAARIAAERQAYKLAKAYTSLREQSKQERVPTARQELADPLASREQFIQEVNEHRKRLADFTFSHFFDADYISGSIERNPFLHPSPCNLGTKLGS